MILVDRALDQRARAKRPIRAAMVGSGFMARGIAHQIVRYSPGIQLAAILCRHPDKGRAVAEQAGAPGVHVTDDVAAVTDDPSIEVLVEVTGTLEYAAHAAVRAIEHGKHLVLMNAELDGTVGPLLKTMADRAGVVYSNSDGDQPCVEMNLYRFVRGIGVRPVLCGNIKGLHDPYRNPTTQEGFARKWGQSVHMVTSAADGTKVTFEQAIVANATGMRVARRGMLGPTVETGMHISQAAGRFPVETLLNGPGIVDYIVGAVPAPGVFVLGTIDDPVQRHYLKLYKLGDGPIYCFYTPYHLCHFEVPNTIARVALFRDSALFPAAGPMVDVVTAAKVDLAPGDILDALGGYKTYGLAENYDQSRRAGLLPIGLSEGCRVVRPVAKDQVLTYSDVERPAGRLIDRLRAEQDNMFPVTTGEKRDA
ncbi:MAG: NAD(P)H-dependent oxidoreductase [Phycisphaerae bacterium]